MEEDDDRDAPAADEGPTAGELAAELLADPEVPVYFFAACSPDGTLKHLISAETVCRFYSPMPAPRRVPGSLLERLLRDLRKRLRKRLRKKVRKSS